MSSALTTLVERESSTDAFGSARILLSGQTNVAWADVFAMSYQAILATGASSNQGVPWGNAEISRSVQELQAKNVSLDFTIQSMREITIFIEHAARVLGLAALLVQVKPNALLGDSWPLLGQAGPTAEGRSLRSEARGLLSSQLASFGNPYAPDVTVVDNPTVHRVEAAVDLLPAEFPLPQVSPSPEGEIGLFWYQGDNRVEAYFDSEGHFTWIGKFNGQFDPGGDVEWRGDLPEEFVRMLHQLYA